MEIYQDLFKSKLKNTFLDNGQKVSTKYQRGNVFEDEKIRTQPLNGYTRPGEPPSYKLVYVDADDDIRDILDEKGDEVIITPNEFNQIKMMHIMNMQDKELENG